jgi:RNA polymerase sporulation-specific sigma factor
MHLRASKKTRNEVFLQEPIGADREGNEITLMDVLQDEGEAVPDLVGRRFQAERLSALLKRLGRRERRVLQMRFGLWGEEPQTQRAIAHTLGISRSYVSRIEKKAIRKLLRELARERLDGTN